MKVRITRIIRYALRALIYASTGAALVLVIVFVVYLNNRTDLEVWHLAELDEEFTVGSGVETFADYLALEERLFKQLDEQVYKKITPEQRYDINRYNRGSLSDPARWPRNWNRSFELHSDMPQAGVLLLHGMSDSPYSLRHLAERLHTAGAYVIGLRMPGHGTAPSGLVDLSWKDMAVAVRLAMRRLAEQTEQTEQTGNRPLYVIGYSTGAALAVQYALTTLEDEALPRVERVVVLSPAIGVTKVAALAVWQARLGGLLGLEKLAWTDILPEYDPFKYGSFAVNAGDVVYQLTNEIQRHITKLSKAGKLADMPPILAFSSVVDATVSTPALVAGLFARLPADGHELVLFDINRMADMEPIMKWDPSSLVQAFASDSDRTFTLSLVTNEDMLSRRVVVYSKRPGKAEGVDTQLGLSWPENVYSLAHIALPFPADDTLYGHDPAQKGPGIHLGDISLHGERGLLRIPADQMLRQRWNPFFPYIETRVLKFLGLEGS